MTSWQTIKLGDAVADVATGPFGSVLHEKDYVAGGIPLVNPINMVDGEIVPDWSKTVSAATLERLSSYVLQEGDLVVARRGDIGRCAIVRKENSG
jgi:type I restriction enzyme, S subunit